MLTVAGSYNIAEDGFGAHACVENVRLSRADLGALETISLRGLSSRHCEVEETVGDLDIIWSELMVERGTGVSILDRVLAGIQSIRQAVAIEGVHCFVAENAHTRDIPEGALLCHISRGPYWRSGGGGCAAWLSSRCCARRQCRGHSTSNGEGVCSSLNEIIRRTWVGKGKAAKEGNSKGSAERWHFKLRSGDFCCWWCFAGDLKCWWFCLRREMLLLLWRSSQAIIYRHREQRTRCRSNRLTTLRGLHDHLRFIAG